MTPSPYVFNKVSIFKLKPIIPYFPTILDTPSIELFSETPALKTKSFPEKKLNSETIFSHSRRKYPTFKKALSSKRFATLSRHSEHVHTNFDPTCQGESNTSSISLFETECPPTKGILFCENPKVSSDPHVLPTETEVKGSSSETSSLSSYSPPISSSKPSL